MRLEAGLRRTAELFDIWNPASGTPEQIAAAVEQINAVRPTDRPPIGVIHRLFTEPPFIVPGVEPLTLDGLAEAVGRARDAGFCHVIIDTSFTTEVESPQDWIDFPARLAPLLDTN